MRKSLLKKLERMGMFDTKVYRYRLVGNDVFRVRREYLDTVAVFTNWEYVGSLNCIKCYAEEG